MLGGGQLGRMLIQSGMDLNLAINALDPDKNAPCHYLANKFTQGSLTDYDTVYSFGKKADVITIEIENVNVDALKQLEKEGKEVYPQPHIIETIQDKGLQKIFFQRNNIPTPDFFLIDNKEQISKYAAFFPFFQKLRKGGYDGKGVVKLAYADNLANAFDAPSVLERLVDFKTEISVIVARNKKGEVKTFPAVECAFNPEANLVEFLFSPAQITQAIEKEAQRLAVDIANKLGIIGILAAEMFVTKNGEVLINELAPRPHNSGHHSIEANITSQFEQHLRAILNLPLGDTVEPRRANLVETRARRWMRRLPPRFRCGLLPERSIERLPRSREAPVRDSGERVASTPMPQKKRRGRARPWRQSGHPQKRRGHRQRDASASRASSARARLRRE